MSGNEPKKGDGGNFWGRPLTRSPGPSPTPQSRFQTKPFSGSEGPFLRPERPLPIHRLAQPLKVAGREWHVHSLDCKKRQEPINRLC